MNEKQNINKPQTEGHVVLKKMAWQKPRLVELPMRDTASAGTPGKEGTGPFGSAIGNS